MLSLLMLLPRQISNMEQTGQFLYRHFAICQVLSVCFALSQGSPALIIVNATDSLAFEANTTCEIHFSVEEADDFNLSGIFVNHKPPMENVSHLKCYLETTSQEFVSRNDCECKCKKEGPGHKYGLKKVFQEADSGQWTFFVLLKGNSLNKTINIAVGSSLEQRSTENSIDSTVDSEGILVSVREVHPPYRLAISHVTNTGKFRLLCVLSVSQDNCTSTDNEMCRSAFTADSAREKRPSQTFRVLVHESGQLLLQVIQTTTGKPWFRKLVNITILSFTKPTTQETEELLTSTIPSTHEALDESSPAYFFLGTSSTTGTWRTATERSECDVIVLIVAATCFLMIFINVVSCLSFHLIARRVLRVMEIYPYGEREKETAKAHKHGTQKPQCSNEFKAEKSLGHATLEVRPSTSSSEDDASYACVYVEHATYPSPEPDAFSNHSDNTTPDRLSLTVF